MPDWSTFALLVRLGEEFGPFLFAILFIVFVTRTAHSFYQECTTRQNPVASEDEKRTYRFYFVCSVWCGIAVMTISIGWWIYGKVKGPHVYQVAIVNIQDNERLIADYFNKQVTRPAVPGAPVVHDYYFLLVKTEPFRVGEKFAFDYYRIPRGVSGGLAPQAHQFEIKYEGRPQDRFRISVEAGAPKLILVADNDRAGWFSTADQIKAFDVQLASAVKANPIWGVQ